MGCLTASGRNAPAAANKVWRRGGGRLPPFFCHSCEGRNRAQAVRVKRAKKSESVGIIKIIPPLTLKKIFKDPIPAYARRDKGGGFYSSYVILWLDHRTQVYMCALRTHKGTKTLSFPRRRE